MLHHGGKLVKLMSRVSLHGVVNEAFVTDKYTFGDILGSGNYAVVKVTMFLLFSSFL